MAARSGRAPSASRRRYRDETLILETEFDTDDGTVRLIDFMPPRGEAPDVVRIVRASRAGCRCGWSCGCGSTTAGSCPWVLQGRRRAGRGGRPGLVLVAHAGGDPRRGPDDGRRVRRRGGRPGAVRVDLAGVPPARAEADRRRSCAAATPRATGAEWLAACTYDGRVAGGGDPLADHAQGADLRSDRRHRRRRHHVAAGEARRRAQLGLPVLLVARRDDHAAGVDVCGLRERGAGLAARGCCGRSPATRPRCRSCTASPASAGCRSTWRTGCPATTATRCGSATQAVDQFQLDVYGEVMDALYQARITGLQRRRQHLGAAASADGHRRGSAGATRTRASGRCAAGRSTSRIPS